MTQITGYRSILSAVALALATTTPALAQDDDGLMTTKELKAEISQAMEAVAAYSEQERDQALTTAREAMTRLDAEIERREQALRENWADMTEPARAGASARQVTSRFSPSPWISTTTGASAGPVRSWAVPCCVTAIRRPPGCRHHGPFRADRYTGHRSGGWDARPPTRQAPR